DDPGVACDDPGVACDDPGVACDECGVITGGSGASRETRLSPANPSSLPMTEGLSHMADSSHFNVLDERYAKGQKIENGVITHARGPVGRLPFAREMLLDSPSGDLFRLSQNVGMGWDPLKLTGKEF